MPKIHKEYPKKIIFLKIKNSCVSEKFHRHPIGIREQETHGNQHRDHETVEIIDSHKFNQYIIRIVVIFSKENRVYCKREKARRDYQQKTSE